MSGGYDWFTLVTYVTLFVSCLKNEEKATLSYTIITFLNQARRPYIINSINKDTSLGKFPIDWFMQCIRQLVAQPNNIV